MVVSFNRVYGKPDDPFYYGLKPIKELETFLYRWVYSSTRELCLQT